MDKYVNILGSSPCILDAFKDWWLWTVSSLNSSSQDLSGTW